jgi:hypothetical protein
MSIENSKQKPEPRPHEKQRLDTATEYCGGIKA